MIIVAERFVRRKTECVLDSTSIMQYVLVDIIQIIKYYQTSNPYQNIEIFFARLCWFDDAMAGFVNSYSQYLHGVRA